MRRRSRADDAGSALMDRMGLGLVAFAALLAANALWMLLEPSAWYHELPAAVPGLRSLQRTLRSRYRMRLRDLGLRPGLGGAGARAAPSAGWRYPPFSWGPTRALHVFDTARGFVDHSHWWIDFPGVYVPAVLSAWLWWSVRPRPKRA